jgi:hypothetical protein
MASVDGSGTGVGAGFSAAAESRELFVSKLSAEYASLAPDSEKEYTLIKYVEPTVTPKFIDSPSLEVADDAKTLPFDPTKPRSISIKAFVKKMLTESCPSVGAVQEYQSTGSAPPPSPKSLQAEKSADDAQEPSRVNSANPIKSALDPGPLTSIVYMTPACTPDEIKSKNTALRTIPLSFFTTSTPSALALLNKQRQSARMMPV